VLLCFNTDRSKKVQILIVGKFKPRCIKGVKHYPCDYKASKNVWVIGKIFRERLRYLERKMACKSRQILLLLELCSAIMLALC
jgi:hypothetical protein